MTPLSHCSHHDEPDHLSQVANEFSLPNSHTPYSRPGLYRRSSSLKRLTMYLRASISKVAGSHIFDALSNANPTDLSGMHRYELPFAASCALVRLANRIRIKAACLIVCLSVVVLLMVCPDPGICKGLLHIADLDFRERSISQFEFPLLHTADFQKGAIWGF